jgi:delta(3,5)-delta(2,4)-dienoyl-CoA isomerase
VNAFSTEFWREYGTLFDSLTRDAYDVRAAVLSSALPKLFTAGIDRNVFSLLFLYEGALKFLPTVIGSLDFTSANGRDVARVAFQTRETLTEFQHAIGAPERTPFPVIVALHGHVIGLGIDLIGSCDIRYAASNTSFSIKVCAFGCMRDWDTTLRLFLKEVEIGLAPDIGSLAFLPKITGNDSLVRELTYTARPFSAIEAEKLGLVSRVVEGGRDEVIKEALELAKLIANKSPVAVASSKHLISHSRDHSVAENLAYTSVWNSAALMTKVGFCSLFKSFRCSSTSAGHPRSGFSQ